MKVFTTPLLKHFLYLVGKIYLFLFGWKVQGEPPKLSKYVIIAAPHTSNWDFPFTLAFAFVYGLDIRWMGKAELFKGIWGPFFKWLGGIPINRSKRENRVELTIQTIQSESHCIIVIPPEGTRKKVKHWKTGFYHIAHGANVPIALGFLDYGNKCGGFGPLFHPTGDMEGDIKEIQEFYAHIQGRNA